MSTPSPIDSPAESILDELALLDHFDRAWREAQMPCLAAFLELACRSGLPESRMLDELIKIDLEHRWRSHAPPEGLDAAGLSGRPCVEDYVRLFPQIITFGGPSLELITEEYRVRARWGDKPAHDGYAQRFPSLAEQLHPLLQRIDAEIAAEQTPVQNTGDWANQQIPPTVAEPRNADESRQSPGPSMAPLPTIPGYELLRLIARGGMGVVYEARQISLNRIVALKMILSRGNDSEEALQRFRTEAEAVAALKHPNIVQIHESGDVNGLPYFSMELVSGGCLAAQVRDHPLPANEAASIVEKLAWAMAAAHEQGIVHRDLKPDNVLIAGDGTPKITDFGLAKQIDSRESLSRHGAILGTPSYMAPEQARGESKTAGPAADTWALGAILYRLTTGRPPFLGADVLDTLRQVVDQQPAPPRQLQPSLPRDLETICLKCLEKDPRKRYGSARALAADLASWQAGRPILARPVGSVERAMKWIKRNPVISGLLTAIVLVSITGSIGIYLKYRDAKDQEEAARKQRAEAIKQAQIAKANEDLATGALSEKEVALDEKSKALKKSDDDRKELRHALALDKIQLARAAFESKNASLATERLEQVPPDLRQWEWYYLKRQFSGGIMTLRMAPLERSYNYVNCVSFSPDGSRVITGSFDGTAKVWDARMGGQLLSLHGHTASVQTVSFSPDGTRIITGSIDKTAKVWNAMTGACLFDVKQDAYQTLVRSFSPDGERIVTRKDDTTAVVNDAKTGELLSTLPVGTIRNLLFSPDGTQILAVGGRTVSVWDVRTSRLLLELATDQIDVLCASFSPDGTRIVTGGWDGTAKIFDSRTGTPCLELKGHPADVKGVSISQDGTRIGTVSGTANVWDAKTGTFLFDLKGHTFYVTSMAFSPDGTQIVTGSLDRLAKVWDAKTGALVRNLAGHAAMVTSVSFSPDGKRIVTACQDNTAMIWDATTGAQLHHLKGKKQGTGFSTGLTSASYSPDGTQIVTGSFDKTAKIWDANSGKLLFDLNDHASIVTSVSFSPDGKRIVTASDGGKVWEASTGKAQFELKGHSGMVRSVTFSPDGTRIVTGSDDNTVRIWDARTGTPLLALKGHTGGVTSVSFSQDGTRIVTGSHDKTARIWDGRGDSASDELEYRLFWTRPRPDLHREEFAKAIQANDTFAARFHQDRVLAYDLINRSPLLAYRCKSLGNDPVLHARTAVHSPTLAKPQIGPIVFRSMQWDPLALRLLGGSLIRLGKPNEAIVFLQLALALRNPDRPPVEELLLALACLNAKQPGEAAKWCVQAVDWLDRHHPVLMAVIGGTWSGTRHFHQSQVDPRYNPFEWETWYECEVFRAEVEAKLKGN